MLDPYILAGLFAGQAAMLSLTAVFSRRAGLAARRAKFSEQNARRWQIDARLVADQIEAAAGAAPPRVATHAEVIPFPEPAGSPMLLPLTAMTDAEYRGWFEDYGQPVG
jgi:hypothetical protein